MGWLWARPQKTSSSKWARGFEVSKIVTRPTGPRTSRNHRRVLAAAKLAAKRSTAIVLGAGKCREIPLEQLAEQFQQVILVDLDGDSMREVVSLLPPPLRSRLQIRVADMTSFAKPLMEQMRDALETSRTAEKAFHRPKTIHAGAPDIQHPPDLPRADLVISSLLLSELHWYRYAGRLLQDKFGVRLTDWSGRSSRETIRASCPG